MKLVGYLRVSTDRQAEHGFGLSVQRQALRQWAKANGHRIVATFTDEGISGANGIDTRRGLYDALRALSDHQADGLIVYSLDRLARRLEVQEAILGQVWAAGGRVFSVGDGGELLEDDPDDPMRTAMRQMRGVFSQLERALITKRMRDGRRHKAEAGEYAGGRPPFGWRAERGRLAPDPGEQATIALIDAMHAAGKSIREIAAELDGDTAHQPRSGRWHPEMVRRVLARPGLPQERRPPTRSTN